MKTIKTLSLFLIALCGASSQATTISLFTLPEGNTIMQVSNALTLKTEGGVATSDTRTLYYFAPDFGDPQINDHDFVGNTWPYVYISGPLQIDSDITADITTAVNTTGEFILINGNPLYQFVGDLSPTDANGNFGPWNFILADGTATQSVSAVPIPAALPLFLSGLLGVRMFSTKKR